MPQHIQLHVFVDASESAFAAVAYWRYISGSKISTSLICAKTKTAPMKATTIPRLELLAAVLGVRLMTTIVAEHSFDIKQYTLWSDSKTILSWINSKHRRYKPFVAHRIAEILASSDSKFWRWISTHDNVADEATRYKFDVDFSPDARWYTGPEFLRNEEDNWPSYTLPVQDDQPLLEEIIRPVLLVTTHDKIIDFDRFSSLNRIKRCMSWVLRFKRR